MYLAQIKLNECSRRALVELLLLLFVLYQHKNMTGQPNCIGIWTRWRLERFNSFGTVLLFYYVHVPHVLAALYTCSMIVCTLLAEPVALLCCYKFTISILKSVYTSIVVVIVIAAFVRRLCYSQCTRISVLFTSLCLYIYFELKKKTKTARQMEEWHQRLIACLA